MKQLSVGALVALGVVMFGGTAGAADTSVQEIQNRVCGGDDVYSFELQGETMGPLQELTVLTNTSKFGLGDRVPSPKTKWLPSKNSRGEDLVTKATEADLLPAARNGLTNMTGAYACPPKMSTDGLRQMRESLTYEAAKCVIGADGCALCTKKITCKYFDPETRYRDNGKW